jgi:hypothetical protein
MLRYLQASQSRARPQVLMILHENEACFPAFGHAAVDQDRPMGEARTFHEHTHDLYHIVLYTQPSGFYVRSGRRYRAEPGTLVIVSPGQSHDFVSLRGSRMYSEIAFAFGTEMGKVLTRPFGQIPNAYTGISGQLRSEIQLPRDTMQELVILMIQIMDYLRSPSSMSDLYARVMAS